MPKINIYVPDELAEAVKEAGIPVSAVCQRALETAVRRVTAIREAVVTPAADLDDSSGRMAHFTPRARAAVNLAVRDARAVAATEIGTEHLLSGLLAENGNLALEVLGVLEIDRKQIRGELDRLLTDGPQATTAHPAETGRPESSPDEDADGLRFGSQAAAALELAVTEAASLGHNYVGCEHLLLGLIAEPDGAGGRILRGLGAELRLTRRAVIAALAGYVHLRAQQNRSAETALPAADPLEKLAALIDQQIKPVVQRLERIESDLKLGGKG